MKKTKITEKIAEAFEHAGCNVYCDKDGIHITYYTNYGGEEFLDIPPDVSVGQFLKNVYDNYDASYEAYIWLDNTGHGKRGAPNYMGDVLADKEEWEKKLEELATLAYKIENEEEEK